MTTDMSDAIQLPGDLYDVVIMDHGYTCEHETELDKTVEQDFQS